MTTTNMLEQMAHGIVEEKTTKGRGLTPLVSERPATVPDVPGSFLTNESLMMTAQDLRAYAAQLTAVADGIDAKTGLTSLGREPVTPGAQRAALDAEAIAIAVAARMPEPDAAVAAGATEQEAFDAALVAQVAAAQAATFMPPSDDPVVTPPGTEEPHANTVSGGWQCPNGHDTVEEKVSPRGRKFARCTTCGEFQK